MMINNIPGLKQECYKTMTTDAASNMRKAMEESMVIDKHFKCVDHVINVCVQRALDEPTVSGAVQKCKDLASATHRSSTKNDKLRSTAIENGGKVSVTAKFYFELVTEVNCNYLNTFA
jgi:hypothetical protein